MKLLRSERLALGLRWIIGLYFLYTSMSKIPAPAQFATLMAAYRVFPDWFIPLGAVVVPWVEFVAGLLLIVGLRTRAAAVVVMLLLLAFNGIIGANLIEGSPITCGCHDQVGEPISWWKLTKNAGWFLLALQVFLYDRLFLLRTGSLFRLVSTDPEGGKR